MIALTDWLEYAYWEGFDDAINYYPDLMATELQRLELPELAAALVTARQVSETIRKQYPENTLKAYIAYSNECNQDKNYRRAEAYLDTHQSLIVERLFDWVGGHATQFP